MINYVVAVHAQLFSNSSIVSVMIQIFIQNAEPFAGFFCVSFPQFQKTGLAVKKSFVFYRILKQEILNPEILKKENGCFRLRFPGRQDFPNILCLDISG